MSEDLDPNAFDAFFAALHGYPPFPWQSRLAREVLLTGWPEVLHLPTGTGKTAAIDVAVFAMAVDACNPARERRMPRRVFLVVDRRIIVDQAFERAEKIARELLKAVGDDGIVGDVARALMRLTVDGSPLVPALLRGGMERDDGWARRPDQPMIGCSTVDQVGSRLLFRGYGPSSRSSSIHAGLVGNDVLFLLDEVHLSRPFTRTLRSVAQEWDGPLPRRWQVVEMSATPEVADADHAKAPPFGLSAADHAVEVLARRLTASKPSQIEVVKTSSRASDRENRSRVADHVVALLGKVRDEHRAIGVMVNRVDTARRIAASLPDEDDVLVVTGRMRPIQRAGLQRRLASIQTDSKAERPPAERPLIVVATQTLEAGADLDFDLLITECASYDALVQRFGRLNRSGRQKDAEGWIVVRKDQINGDDPIYGSSLGETARWLQSLEAIDFCQNRMPTPPLACHRPVVQTAMWRRVDLEQWAMTHPRPVPDPDIEMHLHGVERSAPEVQIVWRDDVDPNDEERWRNALDLRPPLSIEGVSVPLWAADKWLAQERDDISVGDAGTASGERARRQKKRRPFIRWTGTTSETSTSLRPGDTLVVPSDYGGLDVAGVWAPEKQAAVVDLGDQAQWERHGMAVFRRPASGWPDDEDVDIAALRGALGIPSSVTAHDDWRVAAFSHLENVGFRWVGDAIVAKRPNRRPRPSEPFTSADETSSFSSTGRAIGLLHHLEDVARNARAFAEHLGLAEPLVNDLARAAKWHDLGKADPRFQQMLAGGDPLRAAIGELLAKSSISPRDRVARQRVQRLSGYPRGTRHEILSVALCASNPDLLAEANDPDLVLHLVGSHHGFCRPFAPPVLEPDDLDVSIDAEFVGHPLRTSTQHHLARVGSGIAARFHRLQRTYGIHGLAWLEAIVRLADHRASEHPSEKSP